MHCLRVKSADGKLGASKIDTTCFRHFSCDRNASRYGQYIFGYTCVNVSMYIGVCNGFCIFIYLFICRFARIFSHFVSSLHYVKLSQWRKLPRISISFIEMNQKRLPWINMKTDKDLYMFCVPFSLFKYVCMEANGKWTEYDKGPL